MARPADDDEERVIIKRVARFCPGSRGRGVHRCGVSFPMVNESIEEVQRVACSPFLQCPPDEPQPKRHNAIEKRLLHRTLQGAAVVSFWPPEVPISAKESE